MFVPFQQALKHDLYSELAEKILINRFKNTGKPYSETESQFLDSLASELASTVNLINSEQLSKCLQSTISNGIEESVENGNKVPESDQETASTGLIT